MAMESLVNRGSAIFLQGVLVPIGIGTLGFLLWEPHLEGVNAHATLFEMYFTDPFLAIAYVGSVPFFIALYQAFRILRAAAHGAALSSGTAHALRIIRYCALTIICFVAVEEVFILLTVSDDRAGGVFMGILVTFGSIIIAATAVVLEGIVRSAITAFPIPNPPRP